MSEEMWIYCKYRYGGTRSRLQTYGVCGRIGVGTSMCPFGMFICWVVGRFSDHWSTVVSCKSFLYGSAHLLVCCPSVRLFGFRNYFWTDSIAELLVCLQSWESHETCGGKYSVWAKYGVLLMLKKVINVARSELQIGTIIHPGRAAA